MKSPSGSNMSGFLRKGFSIMKKRLLAMMLGLALLISLSGGMAIAQDAEQPAPGDRGERGDRGDRGMRGGPGGMQFDPAQMQERMLNGIKENLGATDEEWTAMKPKVQEIQKLRMKVAASAMGRFGGPRGMRGPDGPGDANNQNRRPGRGLMGMLGNEPNPELDALVSASDSDSTSNDDLKNKIKAYREAVKRDEEKLKSTREELRQLVTLRQEAKLIVAGILD